MPPLFASVLFLVPATVALAYLTWMDLRYFLLPNRANLALAVLGLGFRAATADWSDAGQLGASAFNASLGAGLGAGIFLATRQVSLKWKGVEGIGWGDVKFSAAAGIWLGPAGVGFMVGGSAALLLLFGLAVVALTHRPLKDFCLPFGAAAAPVTAALLWADWAGWAAF